MMAVERMRKGESVAAVMDSYGLCRTTGYKWQQKIRGRGTRALAASKGTGGRHCKLTAAQQKQVFRWINGKNPMQYGFDFGLWTRAVVRELIVKKFAVSLSVTSVGTLLARLGLTPQKPLQCAYQCDPQAIERWQRETYPNIARQARQTGADIHFWDESSFRADAVQVKTLGAKGQTPVVPRPAQRQRISAASAVNTKGAFWFSTYQGDLTGELFVALLKKMLRGHKKPVHLVVDGLPAHKKGVVKTYVAKTGGKLTLHFLLATPPV